MEQTKEVQEMTDDLVKRLQKLCPFHDNPHTVSKSLREAAVRIEQLKAALNKIVQKCPYARREQWCSRLDCNCVVARAALEDKTND